MFRKWALGLVLGVLILFGVFFLFLDGILKRGLESGLERIFQAQVDIGSFDLDYFPMRVRIEDMEIANSRSPMRNLFLISSLDMALETFPLLSGKFIVELLEIKGVSFDTERDRSGAIERKRNVNRTPMRADSSILDAALPELPELEVDFAGSEVQKKSKALASEISRLGRTWTQVEKNGGFESEIAALRIEAEAVSQKFEDINQSSKGPKVFLQLKALKDEFDGVSSRFSDLNSRFEARSSEILGAYEAMTSGISDLDGAAYRDYRRTVSGISLDSSGLPGTSELLFGARIRDRLERVLPIFQRFFGFYSKVAPSPPRPRLSRYPGRTVRFPSSHTLPRVWVKYAQIFGEGNRGEVLTGEFRDLCSDASAINRPFIGNFSGSGLIYPEMSFLLDFLVDIKKEDKAFFHLTGDFNGVPVQQMLLFSESGKKVGLRSGVLGGEFGFDLGFEDLVGNLMLSGQRLVFLDSGFEGPNAGVGGVMSRTLEGLQEISVKTLISGTWNAPQFQVTSDLDGLLKKALVSRLDEKVLAQKRQVRAQYMSLAKDEALKLRKSLDGKKAVVDRFLNEDEEALDSLLDLIGSQRRIF